MSRELYHCVTATIHTHTEKSFFTICSLTVWATGVEPAIYCILSSLLYHCGNAISHAHCQNSFCTIFSSLLPAAGFEPMTFGLWVNCYTNVSLLFYIQTQIIVFHQSLSPNASIWFRVNPLCFMSIELYHCLTAIGYTHTENRVYSHCATATDHRHIKIIFFTICSLTVRATGFKPIIFGLWVKHNTTVLPLLDKNNLKIILSPFALTQSQQLFLSKSSLNYH